jgi:hypothetical protein
MDGRVPVDECRRPAESDGPAAASYPVVLPITFEGGAGVTLAVSRAEVRFATGVACAGGQRLTGQVRFPAEGGKAALILRYVARVARVELLGPSGIFDVSASFERFELASEGIA